MVYRLIVPLALTLITLWFAFVAFVSLVEAGDTNIISLRRSCLTNAKAFGALAAVAGILSAIAWYGWPL